MSIKSNNNITFDSQIKKLWMHIKGFHIVHLIYTGNKLGIFNLLSKLEGEDSFLQIEEIVKTKKLHSPWMYIWCNSAVAWEILEYDGTGKSIKFAPYMKELLTNQGDPRCIVPYFLGCIDHFGPDMKNHETYMLSGKINSFQDHSDDFSNSIADITEGLQTLMIYHILPNIRDCDKLLSSGGTLLDFGCGAGRLLIKSAKKWPNTKLFGIEIDDSGINAANRLINEKKLSNKIKILKAINTDKLHNSSIDIITMIEVLHEIPVVEREKVFKYCYNILKPGGLLLILDETAPKLGELMDEKFHLSIQTQYNEMTWGNIVPTKLEQDILLRKTGFINNKRSLIGTGFTLIEAVK